LSDAELLRRAIERGAKVDLPPSDIFAAPLAVRAGCEVQIGRSIPLLPKDDVDPIPRLWRRVLEHAVHADDAMQIAERQHDAKPILEDRPCALDRV
jgi:hypothetical protein